MGISEEECNRASQAQSFYRRMPPLSAYSRSSQQTTLIFYTDSDTKDRGHLKETFCTILLRCSQIGTMKESTLEPGLKIELTLHDIHGVVSETDMGDVTATVAFTGTAPSMQVSSFSMCGRSGNLVIESNILETVAADNLAATIKTSDDKAEGLRRQRFATFNDPMEGRRSIASSGQSTSSSSSTPRPHLQLKLSSSKQVPPPIERPNSRDSSRTCPAGGEKHAWLEIVVLHVTLRNRDYSVCAEGTARIILGEEKRKLGTQTMDLAIQSDPQQKSHVQLGFSEDAYIRVRLVVTSADHPSPSPGEIRLSEHFDQEEMDGLMSKLKADEEIAEARTKVNMSKFPQEEKGSHRIFCNSGLDFTETLRGVVDALTRCDRRRTKGRKGRGFIPIIRTSSTMDSTIETRESLLI